MCSRTLFFDLSLRAENSGKISPAAYLLDCAEMLSQLSRREAPCFVGNRLLIFQRAELYFYPFSKLLKIQKPCSQFVSTRVNVGMMNARLKRDLSGCKIVDERVSQ